MSDDLFTDEPPTEPGWYWVRGISGWHISEPFIARIAGKQSVIFAGKSWNTDDMEFGPRIPTPEQCAAMAKE